MYFGTVKNLMTNRNLDSENPNGTIDMLCWFGDVMLKRRYGIFLRNE